MIGVEPREVRHRRHPAEDPRTREVRDARRARRAAVGLPQLDPVHAVVEHQGRGTVDCAAPERGRVRADAGRRIAVDQELRRLRSRVGQQRQRGEQQHRRSCVGSGTRDPTAGQVAGGAPRSPCAGFESDRSACCRLSCVEDVRLASRCARSASCSTRPALRLARDRRGRAARTGRCAGGHAAGGADQPKKPRLPGVLRRTPCRDSRPPW